MGDFDLTTQQYPKQKNLDPTNHFLGWSDYNSILQENTVRVFGVRFLFGFWCSVRFSNLPNCSVFGSV